MRRDQAETKLAADELPGRHRPHLFPARLHRLTPRFSDDELASIAAAAAAVGMTSTGFCAEAAVAAATGVPPASAGSQDRQALASLQRQLFNAVTAVNRIGTNLNQAVARLNATGEAPAWLDRAVVLCLRSVDRLDEVAAGVHRALR
jgi:hypothetical protein